MSVTVRRERPDQRRHHRVTAPLHVTVGGHTLRAADWSLGGLRVEGHPGPIPAPGTAISLDLSLPFQGFNVAFTAEGEVVRNDTAKGMFALKFTRLGEREQELMQHFVEELVRGSMSDVADTIQRIDVPITPVSTKPDPSPLDAVPMSRWPVKTILFTSLYALLGLFVFSYIAMMAYTNVFRLEVDTAVISAPLVTVQAPNDGHVMWTGVKPGDVVRAGTVVLQVADNALERDIDMADIDIRAGKAKLANAKRQLVETLAQIDTLNTVQQTSLEQLKVKLEAAKETARIADAQHQRILGLFKKGYATHVQLDAAERDAVTAKAALDEISTQIAGQAELASKDAGGRYFTGSQFLGERAKIEADIKLLDQEVTLSQQRKLALMEHRMRLAVVAPFDGLLLELPRVDHASVNRGDVIAVMEQPRARMVTAYLTQDEVLHVGIGDEAIVYVPAFNATLKAKVSGIDRTSGFADEMNARYGWRGTRDRSAMVTLQLLSDDAREMARTYRSGTPAVVIFQSRSQSDIIGQIVAEFNSLPVLGGSSGAVAETQSFEQAVPGAPPQDAAPAAADPLAAPDTPGLRPSIPDTTGSLRPSLDEGASPLDAQGSGRNAAAPAPARAMLPETRGA